MDPELSKLFPMFLDWYKNAGVAGVQEKESALEKAHNIPSTDLIESGSSKDADVIPEEPGYSKRGKRERHGSDSEGPPERRGRREKQDTFNEGPPERRRGGGEKQDSDSEGPTESRGGDTNSEPDSDHEGVMDNLTGPSPQCFHASSESDSDEVKGGSKDEPTPQKKGAGTKGQKCVPGEAYAVDDYFSKKMTPAKSKLHHLLRKASDEAQIRGNKSFKEANRAQKKYITDRVLSECPELKGFEHQVDATLKRLLVQAKFYKRKKENEGHKRSSPKKSKVLAPKNPKPTVHGKQRVKKVSTSEKSRDKSLPNKELSQYGSYRLHGQHVNNEVRKAIMSCDSATLKDPETMSPGEFVTIKLGDGVPVAECIFIAKKNDMYGRLAFGKFKIKCPTTELPEAVCPAFGREKKDMLEDLEKDDIFQWKMDRISKIDIEPTRRSTRSKNPPEMLMH